MGVGGIEPHPRIVAQGLTPYCDHIVIVFVLSCGPTTVPLLDLYHYSRRKLSIVCRYKSNALLPLSVRATTVRGIRSTNFLSTAR